MVTCGNGWGRDCPLCESPSVIELKGILLFAGRPLGRIVSGENDARGPEYRSLEIGSYNH